MPSIICACHIANTEAVSLICVRWNKTSTTERKKRISRFEKNVPRKYVNSFELSMLEKRSLNFFSILTRFAFSFWINISFSLVNIVECGEKNIANFLLANFDRNVVHFIYFNDKHIEFIDEWRAHAFLNKIRFIFHLKMRTELSQLWCILFK